MVIQPSELFRRTFWSFAREFSSFWRQGALSTSDADPGHGSARLLVRPRGPLLQGSRLQTHGPTGPCGPEGDQLLVIMRPRRLTGTSRRPPIGWPQRGSGVRRPRVTSTLLKPRSLCRSTSRQASVRETPNVAARSALVCPSTIKSTASLVAVSRMTAAGSPMGVLKVV